MTRADQKSNLTLTEMERQIAETREELGAIVEELAAKTDISGRAKAKAAETASRMRETAHRAATTGPVARLHTGAGHARDRSREKAAGLTGTAHDAGAHLAVTAQETGSHLARPLHDVGARAGVRLRRTDGDQARVMYAAAAVVLSAAAVVALRWSRRHGDLGGTPAGMPSWTSGRATVRRTGR